MPQIFHPSTNTLSKLSIFGAVFFLLALGWIVSALMRSSYFTGVSVAREQPVPFSHKHHVTGLDIDCRYCHTAVEDAAFAGIPATHTCMTCHSQVWSDSDMLAPVRESYKSGQSLEWTRVHALADFVYFNHSIHVKKGIGCVSCHGQVDQMPLMWKENTLYMEWCLDCHRQPENHVRPQHEVFNMHWQAPGDQLTLGKALVAAYDIESLTSCSVCHR